MVYADNAATTRISDSVFDKMVPFLREQYGNASNLYSFGVKSRRAIESARSYVATAIKATPEEIIFTSGGSEGNSWILSSITSGSIITSSIEHPSVLNACHALKKRGIRITYLPVDNNGIVSIEALKNSISSDTKLVSIMLANNEIGTIQPIAEIGAFLKENNILFHTDTVQAVGHIPIDVQELNVDFLTASAHKFYGAKGVGFVYKRSDVDLPSYIWGGHQENGIRAGTENVAGIVGLSCALEKSITEMSIITKRLGEITEYVTKEINSHIPEAKISAYKADRLPGIINITFDGVTGESLMHLLDLKGICISTGSACTSDKNEPSHVLKAIGLSDKRALSAIRISFGRYNTFQDAKSIATEIVKTYKKIIDLQRA